MKTALLTFHNALNYGAALQAYATQRTIQELGADCEMIDYVNAHRKDGYNMFAHAKAALKHKQLPAAAKFLLGSVFMHRRRKQFMRFFKKHCVWTKQQYATNESLGMLNGVYDKFIVGSDQVWNYKHTDADFAYLLSFVSDDDRKIAFASSFGLSDIPDCYTEAYQEYLGRIKHLSTRERLGVELIQKLTGREATLVLDPVFLLNREQWLALSPKRESKQRFVFAYLNRPSQWNDFLSATSYPMKGRKVHKISRHLSPGDFLSPQVRVSYSISPGEFIWSIHNADLVVSASFHCVAMAIVLGAQFVAVLTGDEGKDERIVNVLRIAGLEDRVLQKGMTAADVQRPIDYNLVNNNIAEHIEFSREFLKSALFSDDFQLNA